MSELPSGSTWAGAPVRAVSPRFALQVPRPFVASGTDEGRIAHRSGGTIRRDRGDTFAPGGPLLTIVDVRDRRLRDRGRGDGARRLGARVPAASGAAAGRRARRAVPLAGRRARPGRPARIRARVASVAAVVASAVAFLFVLREAWRGHISLRTAVILAVGAHVVVATLPLLFSRDVYSYIAYGNIAGIHHANPYVQTPIDFPGDAVVEPGRAEVALDAGGLRAAVHGVRVASSSGSWTPCARRSQVFRLTALAASLGHARADRHDRAPGPAARGPRSRSRRSG